MIETLIQDVRYGFRTLARAPAFMGAALLTLALGIGANTAIFSVVHGVLLRPLPYPDPERLVQFVRNSPGGPGTGQDGSRYLFFRDDLESVTALAASSGGGSFNLVSGDGAEFVTAFAVSKEYFEVFGVTPFIGQGFSAEHDVVGGPDVAILSHGLWRRHFKEDPSVPGRTLLLADRTFTVIGVMPESFKTTGSFDLMVPLRPSTTGRGAGFNYSVVGRLQSGVTVQQASAEAAGVWEAFREQHGGRVLRNEQPSGFIPYQQSIARPIRPLLLVLLGAVALLLLIACANTANLLLARATGRSRELAVRAALGAGRARLVRQLLTESMLLAIAGGLLGVAVAYWMLPVLLSLGPPGFLLANHEVRLDGVVLVASLALAAATGVLFGLGPALSLSRRDLVEAFKEDAVRATSSRRAGFLRQGLVVAEVALSTILLVAAGLLLQTFVNLRTVDTGFDPRGVLTARMAMQGERYSTPADLNRFYSESLERIRRIPGVEVAAVANGLPIDRALNLNVDTLDGPENIQDALTDWRYVSEEYFRTMRIPIVAGRGFTDADGAGAPAVAAVSEEFARRFFKSTSAIGRHIRVFDADGSIEIVGIVRDLTESGLKTPPLPVMYVPVRQTHAAALRTTHAYFPVNWVVRAATADPTLPRAVEAAIRQVDPRQPVSAFRTMEDVKSMAAATERFQTTLVGLFAGIGLALAAAGIYGVLACTVAQRTRELGIRVALGATRGDILASVVRTGVGLALVGLALGFVASLGVTGMLQRFVWGVSPTDPLTFAVVAVVLTAVAAVASLVPAVRAIRVDPVTALRT
ncbi:MAG TPA: ABC transporter permease [Vicinamibacterales bacterium]|nr:ABC transporter permease [Vicinamibacterales bacterium]